MRTVFGCAQRIKLWIKSRKTFFIFADFATTTTTGHRKPISLMPLFCGSCFQVLSAILFQSICALWPFFYTKFFRWKFSFICAGTSRLDLTRKPFAIHVQNFEKHRRAESFGPNQSRAKKKRVHSLSWSGVAGSMPCVAQNCGPCQHVNVCVHFISYPGQSSDRTDR